MKVVKNDLFDYGLEIYQDEKLFKFSLDSILLAEFVENKAGLNTIVDFCCGNGAVPLDRKSTRLNSSHVSISYAVFCLKKKKKKVNTGRRN